MFREKTTFVIGAGASAEFGMPVGWELAKLIKASALITNFNAMQANKDRFFVDTLKRICRDNAEQIACLNAAKIIHQGIHTAVSIDAFIDRFSGNEKIAQVGKMLIALEIAKAEAECSMSEKYWSLFEKYPNIARQNKSQKQLTNPDDTWIGSFFRILCDGISDPNELGKNISIICFNYDRCIEHYLKTQIAAAYNITATQAHRIVKDNFNIIHPYGTLGDLPIREFDTTEGVLAFGAELDGMFDLEKVSRSIRTYTEQQHEKQTLARMHQAVANCQILTFLGFGFNNQNLDLLRVAHLDGNDRLGRRQIYSSGLGIARQVETTLKRRILHLIWENGHRTNGHDTRTHIEFDQSCTELFKTHNMNFSSFTRSYFDDGTALRITVSSQPEQMD
jgi:hypothetical protein